MIVRIEDIRIEGRTRKDLGDIGALASSIAEVGLLHPPVVTPELVLIAGERRLRAMETLGLTECDVTVMDFGAKLSKIGETLGGLNEPDRNAVYAYVDAARREVIEELYEFNERFDDPVGECAACGYFLITQKHHYVPRWLGGTDDPRNTIILCPNDHALTHSLMRTMRTGNSSENDECIERWVVGEDRSPSHKFMLERIGHVAVETKGWD